MTYHKGTDGQPAKLTCEHYDYEAAAPASRLARRGRR